MRKFLEKHGWRLHSVKKNGCMKIVKWVDPKPIPGQTTHMIYPQFHAVQIQRDRNMRAKIARTPLPQLRAVAVVSPAPDATGTAGNAGAAVESTK